MLEPQARGDRGAACGGTRRAGRAWRGRSRLAGSGATPDAPAVRGAAGGQPPAAAAAAAGGPAGRGHSRRQLRAHRRRRVGQGRQHLRRRRVATARQRARREVRQGRPLHQVVGISAAARPGSSTRCTASRSTRRATSTSPTPATSASRCSTATARSKTQFANVGTPAAICITPGAHQYLYSVELERRRVAGQRRDLQARARRQASSASSAAPASCRKSSAW